MRIAPILVVVLSLGCTSPCVELCDLVGAGAEKYPDEYDLDAYTCWTPIDDDGGPTAPHIPHISATACGSWSEYVESCHEAWEEASDVYEAATGADWSRPTTPMVRLTRPGPSWRRLPTHAV